MRCGAMVSSRSPHGAGAGCPRGVARCGRGDDGTLTTTPRKLTISADTSGLAGFPVRAPEPEEMGVVGGADPSRRFVPSSVLPVLQLVENTVKSRRASKPDAGGSSPPRRANTPNVYNR